MASQSKTAKTEIREFDPARVRPLPGQPRKRFAGIEALARSIKQIGQTTPGLDALLEFQAWCEGRGVPFKWAMIKAMKEFTMSKRSEDTGVARKVKSK